MASSQLAAARLSVRAAFAGFFLETLLFGGLVVTYVGGTWMLVSARSRSSCAHGRSTRDVNLHIASATMFLLAAVHIATDLHITTTAGLSSGADVETLAKHIAALNSPGSFGALKIVLYVFQTSIADSFMIYRAFIVWNSSWWVIATPLTLLVCEALFGFGVAAIGRTHTPLATLTSLKRAYFLLTVITNLIALGLILRPVLQRRGRLQEYRPEGSRVRTVRWRMMESILQSAAIFTVSSLAFTVTLFVSPLANGICHYLFPPIVSLVFSLAVTRISLNAGAAEHPRRSMLEANLNFHAGPADVHSYPGAATGAEGLDVLDEESCCGHTPIAIHVSVSTMRSSDHQSLASYDLRRSVSVSESESEAASTVKESEGIGIAISKDESEEGAEEGVARRAQEVRGRPC